MKKTLYLACLLSTFAVAETEATIPNYLPIESHYETSIVPGVVTTYEQNLTTDYTFTDQGDDIYSIEHKKPYRDMFDLSTGLITNYSGLEAFRKRSGPNQPFTSGFSKKTGNGCYIEYKTVNRVTGLYGTPIITGVPVEASESFIQKPQRRPNLNYKVGGLKYSHDNSQMALYYSTGYNIEVNLYNAIPDNPCPEPDQLITSYTIPPNAGISALDGAFVNGDDFVVTSWQKSKEKAPSGRTITEMLYTYYDSSTGELTDGVLARYGLAHKNHYLGSPTGSSLIPRVSGTNSPGFLVSYYGAERQEGGYEFNLYTHFVDADFSVKTERYDTKISRPSPFCLTPYGYDQAHLADLDSNANYYVFLKESAVNQFSAYKVWLYDANGQRLDEKFFYNFNPLESVKVQFKDCLALMKSDRLSASNISINNLNEVSVQSIRSGYHPATTNITPTLFHRRISFGDE